MLSRTLLPKLLPVAAALALLTGCSAATESAESTHQASSNVLRPNAEDGDFSLEDVALAISSLDSLRNGKELAPYYADGARLDGCWRNPAGHKLSDLQKTFYCSMPLEFRLCNTVALLTIDESKVDERYDAYLSCQKKVDAVFGGKGQFVFDANVNSVYKTLYLERVTLSELDTENIIVAHKPDLTTRPFPLVLGAIGLSLTKEAADLAVKGLPSLADDYRDETSSEPR